MMQKLDISSMLPGELQSHFCELGLPKYKALQVFRWLMKGISSFHDMSDLSKSDRSLLDTHFFIAPLFPERTLTSKDGTVKYLFRLPDGYFIETVLMQHRHGVSLCISCQVGCKMGCVFCASGANGFVRNLTAAELLQQILQAQRLSGLRVDSLVMMGMGEPLDSLDTVLRFLELVHHPDGICLSHRHISLSTCGLIDGINRLAEENLQITLSVSLHAATQSAREKILPVAKANPLPALMRALKDYFEKTGRRISFEYTMIEGVNDREEDALALSALLKGFPSHINLISLNETAHYTGAAPNGRRGNGFLERLLALKLNATLRRSVGGDIAAACGQLASQGNKDVK